MYLPFPKPFTGPTKKEDSMFVNGNVSQIEALRQALLDEKDKYILSDKNTLETVKKVDE